MPRRGRGTLLAGVSAIAALIATGAMAQEAPPAPTADPGASNLDEVVVTARRRSERLQDVPIAISAITAQTLEDYNVTDLAAVGSLAPQLRVSVGGPAGGAQIYMRGIGSSANTGFDPAVGIVIDGVFYNRTMWLTQSFVDMAGVEVLRGPQSLYYGKNTPAGLINVTTGSPGAVFEARAQVGYEFEAAERYVEGFVSGPLSDTVGARLAVRHSEMDGWIDVASEPRPAGDPLGLFLPGTSRDHLPGSRDTTGRLTLTWDPSSDFSASLKIQASVYEDAGNAARAEIFSCQGPGGTAQPVFGVSDPNEDCQANGRVSRTDPPVEFVAGFPELGNNGDFTDYDSYSVALNASYDLGWAELSSITGLNRYRYTAFGDSTYAATAQFYAFEEIDNTAFSQELRLLTKLDGPVQFLVGGYFQDSDFDFRNSSRVAAVPPDPVTGNYFSWDRLSTQRGRSYSVFGEVTWDINPLWELAVGARYTDEQKDAFAQNVWVNPALAAAFTVAPFNAEIDATDLSPQATLSYRPTENLTIYGAYKEGWKAGGFNHQSTFGITTTLDQLVFGPETAAGFEVGLRGTLFDRRLRFDANVYDYDYDDLQVTAFNSETTSFIVRNAASASVRGIEMSGEYFATDELRLRGNLSYNRARFTEFFGQCYAGQTVEQGCAFNPNPNTSVPTSQDLSGKQPALAPDWNGGAGFTWERSNVFGTLGLAVTGDARYSSDYPIDVTNRPDVFQDSFWIYDAAVRLYSEDERWNVALIGRNLGDEAVKLQGADRPGTGGPSGLAAGAPNAGRLADGRAVIDRMRQVTLQLTVAF
jgi:outer membrane receptor protein involved in Fe transport